MVPYAFALHLAQTQDAAQLAAQARALHGVVRIARHLAAASTDPTAPRCLARIEALVAEACTRAGLPLPAPGALAGTGTEAAGSADQALRWLWVRADRAEARVLRHVLQELQHALARLDLDYGATSGLLRPRTLESFLTRRTEARSTPTDERSTPPNPPHHAPPRLKTRTGGRYGRG